MATNTGEQSTWDKILGTFTTLAPVGIKTAEKIWGKDEQGNKVLISAPPASPPWGLIIGGAAVLGVGVILATRR